MSAAGSVGVPYRLWASTNVTASPIIGNWSLISSGTVSTSSFAIQDSAATNYPARYYRFSVP
ncbi:MAG: hypothetical protein MUF81_20920 [Verrucomicrobia bacterium]|nr:hypothetical protein [Verrucomicrobiota bacterium]